jgi:hypothetical protein
MPIPYSLVPLVAVTWLTVRHVYSAGATAYAKRLVAGLTAASVLAAWLWPWLSIPASLLQIAICVYILLHQVVWCPVGKSAEAPVPLPRHESDPSAKTDRAGH